MSDTRTLVLTIIGTGVGLAVLLTGVMFALIGGVTARIDDAYSGLSARIDDVHSGLSARIDDVHSGLSARIDRIEMRLDGFDGRLRNVEIAFGKVDQRLLTIERVVLPGPDAGR